MSSPIPTGDLKRQYEALQHELDAAALRVLRSGWYILGAEVRAFEEAFAAYCGAAHCVGVASGTDALYLALAALDIGPGDEVVTVANACIYQAAAIVQTGATAVFADIDPATHTMSPPALEEAITPRTRAIMPVHLYGRMANMPIINTIAARHGLTVVEDAAQAHGAWLPNLAGKPQRAGAWGTLACFSFYPSKNLGAVGDGGAVVTNDPHLAEKVRRLRQYGWGSKYVTTEENGRNSRLDEMQAALLRVKLSHLDEWNAARRERAAWYSALLSPTCASLELLPDDPGHVYHLYVVTTAQRNELRAHLHAAGVATDVHYPLPAHMQAAYPPRQMRPTGAGSLPYTEHAARQVLSLPFFPELSRAEVEQVAAAVQRYFDG
jgi:dTDP-4-amino-4,6-dideoxygalactose transaminase